MDQMADFLKFMIRRRAGDDDGAPQIDRILARDGERLHSLDPDTGRQWARLQSVAAMVGQKKRVTAPAGLLRWPRPVIGFIGVVALIVVAGLFVLNRASTVMYNTAQHEQSTVTLGDSSEVTLNQSSELIVERRPFDDTRRVGLKGEAFFRVRRTGAPFVVSTEIGAIRVLGTEFNVRVRDRSMEVAVLKGRVEVLGSGNASAGSVILSAGEMTMVSGEGPPGMPAPIPYPDYPGWMYARFHFQHTSIADACTEIEARFGISIILRDPGMREKTVTGVLDGHTVQSALSALCTLAGREFRYEDGVYIVY
jgi:transmembrane sensor